MCLHGHRTPVDVPWLRAEAARHHGLGEAALVRGDQAEADLCVDRARECLEGVDYVLDRHAAATRENHPQVGSDARRRRLAVTYVSTWDEERTVISPAVLDVVTGKIVDVSPSEDDTDDLWLLTGESIMLPDGTVLEVSAREDGTRSVADPAALAEALSGTPAFRSFRAAGIPAP